MSSYAYIVVDLLSSSPEALEEGNKVFSDALPEIFNLRDDEEVVVRPMPDWEKRAELYPEEPYGPGSSEIESMREEDEDADPISAIRYKLHVTSFGSAGESDNDFAELREISENMPDVRIVISYLYYWLDDIGMVGFADIVDGELDDEEYLMFRDDPVQFVDISRIWVGWEFSEEEVAENSAKNDEDEDD